MQILKRTLYICCIEITNLILNTMSKEKDKAKQLKELKDLYNFKPSVLSDEGKAKVLASIKQLESNK